MGRGYVVDTTTWEITVILELPYDRPYRSISYSPNDKGIAVAEPEGVTTFFFNLTHLAPSTLTSPSLLLHMHHMDNTLLLDAKGDTATSSLSDRMPLSTPGSLELGVVPKIKQCIIYHIRHVAGTL